MHVSLSIGLRPSGSRDRVLRGNERFLSGPVPAGITRSGDAPERWHSQAGGMGVAAIGADVLLVHVAPTPVLPRLDRLDDRMVCQVGVGRCVAIRRRVAAPDQTKSRAHAEVHPPAPHCHARLATARTRDDRTDELQGSEQ